MPGSAAGLLIASPQTHEQWAVLQHCDSCDVTGFFQLLFNLMGLLSYLESVISWNLVSIWSTVSDHVSRQFHSHAPLSSEVVSFSYFHCQTPHMYYLKWYLKTAVAVKCRYWAPAVFTTGVMGTVFAGINLFQLSPLICLLSESGNVLCRASRAVDQLSGCCPSLYPYTHLWATEITNLKKAVFVRWCTFMNQYKGKSEPVLFFFC